VVHAADNSAVDQTGTQTSASCGKSTETTRQCVQNIVAPADIILNSFVGTAIYEGCTIPRFQIVKPRSWKYWLGSTARLLDA
jgi:hypothetical protein